jgi:NADH dehydrogenase
MSLNFNVANSTPSNRILILGGGFAGIGVLKKLQEEFISKDDVEITLIDKDNFLLFSPMLPEIVSGMIETRHIVTPIRAFCKTSKFYEAKVKNIDLENKKVQVVHTLGKESNSNAIHTHEFEYDYLVIGLGSEDNFFGNENIEKNSFTLKTINDAIILRNHLIKILEQANLEHNDTNLRKSLLTFVVVGGGFSGVETVGAVNDFVRDTIKEYYPGIYMTEVRVILVSATDAILEQIDEELGKFALEKLKANGVEFIMNSKVKDVQKDKAILDNDEEINTFSLIWTAGVTQSKLISDLNCEHDKSHRIVTNEYLEVKNYENTVYALGDCASIIDPHTGKPYPPTAQHAIRQSDIVAENIITSIKTKNHGLKRKFDYKTKGMMAQIGKRSGVAILFGKIKLHGIVAWWLWRSYYLVNIPTAKKKLKVIGDWTSDLIYKPDVSQIH